MQAFQDAVRGLITTGGVAFKGWPMDCLSNTLPLSSVLFPQAPQGWAPAQSVWWPLSKAFRRLWQGSRTVLPPRITVWPDAAVKSVSMLTVTFYSTYRLGTWYYPCILVYNQVGETHVK